jgi:hypothetical protein
MKMLRRLLHMTFWYDLALRTTIATTLKKRACFTAREIEDTRGTYLRLYREHRTSISDIQSEYHLSWSSMIASIYLTLKGRGMAASEAVELTGALVFENMGADAVAGYIAKGLDRAKDCFAYIVASSRRQEVSFFGRGFGFYRPVDSDKAYHLRVRKCFYLDFFRKIGFPELMAVACEWDLISWSKGIDPVRHGISFSRPLTLGLDDSDCQFDFEKLV